MVGFMVIRPGRIMSLSSWQGDGVDKSWLCLVWSCLVIPELIRPEPAVAAGAEYGFLFSTSTLPINKKDGSETILAG